MPTNYSYHSQQKAPARGITPQMIDATRPFGDPLRTDGSLYYFMGHRGLKRMLKVYRPCNPDKFLGVVVVCDPTDSRVITTYKNLKWPKCIRNKR